MKDEANVFGAWNSSCDAICDKSKIRSLASARDPSLAEKFDHLLFLNPVLRIIKGLKWCPSVPHCGNAIRLEDHEVLREVECACGLEFCFGCPSEVIHSSSLFMPDVGTLDQGLQG